MNIQQIHPNFVCQLWPAVKDMLAEALTHSGGEYSIDQLKLMLVRGEHVLLIAENAEGELIGAATVTFDNFPNARIAFISAVGGRMLANEETSSLLSDWCRSNGCTRIRGAVRDSVARLFKKLGFEERYIIVEQKL